MIALPDVDVDLLLAHLEYVEWSVVRTQAIVDELSEEAHDMKGGTPRQVIYSSDTKWMRGTEASNKPSSLDDLKENWYINCKGTYDGVKLVASACRFREAK